jgi:hypothetical protein
VKKRSRSRVADAFWRWIGEDVGAEAPPETREEDDARVALMFPKATRVSLWDRLDDWLPWIILTIVAAGSTAAWLHWHQS